MAPQVFVLDKVPEDKLVAIIQMANDDNADIVTAVNDGQGTFTVEQTFGNGTSTSSNVITLVGKMSTFGGPDDPNVGLDEGLSLFDASDVNANPDLFLATQPPDTTGLAKRLNPDAKYLACRWDLDATPKSFLRTTKVTVSNPANNRSESARPADTGPAISTGRVADLSPGLATALGLETSNTCKVEIPLPASETGLATAINLKTIDTTIFPNNMVRTLVVMTTSDNTTYWVVNQIGQNEGGQTLLRHIDGKTEILFSDSTVFPIKVTDQVSAAVAAELNKAASTPTVAGATSDSPTLQVGEDVSAKVFAAAKAFVGFVTSSVPGTDNGNLACAWAVNEVVRRALGTPISSEGGSNGLSTDGIFDVLRTSGIALTPAQVHPGVIVISPTEGAEHGHVGIVGQNPGGQVGNTQIYSNSSSAKRFEQNYTTQSWTEYYTGKNLRVLFFTLKA
jgi:hypothetical protein